jgi:hypothetical protein
MRRLLLTLPLVLLGCPQEKLKPALPPDIRVDRYDQQAASKVDILWVVDNSGSMAPRQENLAKNFQSFIDLFSKGSIDFRIAITTTDIFKDAGTFKGTPKILTPSTVGAFATNIKVGTDGSPYEAGLEAAQLALERQAAVNAPKLQQIETCKTSCSQQANPITCAEQCLAATPIDFLRPDAYLYLIFVSDEEDRSSLDVRYYWRAFETAKGIGNDGTVTTAAIIGDVPSNSCGATPGTRYVGLSGLTGGEVGSICDVSFATTLRKLATNAVGLKRKFALSRKPNVSTIQVFVRYPCNAEQLDSEVFKPCAEVNREECAGAPAESVNAVCTPTQGGPDGWSYEPENQVIFFAGDSVPGLRSTVEFYYYPEGIEP